MRCRLRMHIRSQKCWKRSTALWSWSPRQLVPQAAAPSQQSREKINGAP